MDRHQLYLILPLSFDLPCLCLLFFQLLRIFCNMDFPFIIGFEVFTPLLKLCHHIHQLLPRNLMFFGIFFQEIIISDLFSDILDCRIRCHILHHTDIHIKLVNNIQHPVLIAIKFTQILKIYLPVLHTVPCQIPEWSVTDRQEKRPVPLSCCQLQICHHIFYNKMPVKIGHIISHFKRDTVFA